MKKLIIVGLGPGNIEHLTLGTWNILLTGKKIYFRTAKHPVVQELADKGVRFESFDWLYERKETFAQVYQDIVNYILGILQGPESIQLIYGVPGHPLAGEESVRLLLEQARAAGIAVTLIPGMSFIDNVCTVLEIDPAKGLLILDALDCQDDRINTGCHIIFTQVYNRLVASDLKLSLLESYSYNYPAAIVRAAGISGHEQVITVPLCELDHGDNFNHLTCVYLPPAANAGKSGSFRCALDPLLEVMDKLLSPQGCPWDRQQDHFSLKPYLLEEVYEVIEAIDSKDMNKLEEELGDLLLQIVFHAKLAQKRGDFTSKDIIKTITEKMIRRHPHVFGNADAETPEEVLVNWEKIKAVEKNSNGTSPARVMDGLNKALPALLLAEEVQKRAKKVGFDWNEAKGAWDKLFEEIDELKEAFREKINMEEEIGDILFAVVNIARFAKFSPEAALFKTIQKFINRFNYIEQHIVINGKTWSDMSLESLDILWEKAKKEGL